MKITIVTNLVYSHTPRYAEYTDTIKERFCEKTGNRYLRLSRNFHKSLSPYFSKYGAIRQALDEGADWAIWMDGDAAPVTFDADLPMFLASHERHVVMLKDAVGWNSGVFAVPSTDRAREWLDWLDKDETCLRFSHGYYDQDAMSYSFAHDFKDLVRDDGYDFGLNSYDDVYRHAFKPNLFVKGKSWCLHLPGTSEDYRNERFGNILREMDGKPPVTIVRKNDLSGRKLVDYMHYGCKILVQYPHGLGDLIMFYPFFQDMKKKFNDVSFGIEPEEKLRTVVPPQEVNRDNADVIFYMPARFNEVLPELKGMVKPECNVVHDIGMEYDPSLEFSDPIVPPSPEHEKSCFVGVNFCCSSYPDRSNCPYDTAKMLWDRLVEEGFFPIEVYSDKTGRRENLKYDFVRNTMRQLGSGINRMMWVLSVLRGMASVSTGTFHYAMAAYPETTLYLKKDFDASFYTHKKVLQLDVAKPDRGVVNEWINRLKESSTR